MTSDASAAAAAAPEPPKVYFCHQCERSVSVSPLPDGDVFCPLCCGGFVEELDPPNPNPDPNPNPNPNPNPRPVFSFATSDHPFFLSPSPSPLPFFLSPSASPSPSSFDLRHPSDIASLFGSDPSALRSSFTSRSGAAAVAVGSGGVGPTQFNPFAFIQDHFHQLLSGGASIQVVLDGGPVGGNLGDYFLGPGLEQLIQQLAENDPNRYGTPPASISAVANLPDIKISCDLLDSNEAQCAVCMDAFEIGSEAKQLLCKHIFHRNCILPWLELHSTCPVCRHQLPTDDLGYEQRREAGAAAAAAAAVPAAGQGVFGAGFASAAAGTAGRGAPGGGNSPGPGPRIVERRVRISLPWPFRAFGSQAEASNAGGEGGGGGGGGDANSGGQGNTGSETRQEDLD